jgi:hypothetical protein
MTMLRTNLIGEWVGTNLLRLSWVTPSDHTSGSLLSVAPIAKGMFLTFAYKWSHENAPQEGLILLGYDQVRKIATAAWVDSWHMSSKIMSCEGSIDEDGVVSLRGTYEAPPGPDWGWRITIALDADENLRITMYNCPPEGAEELAVQADYRRVA